MTIGRKPHFLTVREYRIVSTHSLWIALELMSALKRFGFEAYLLYRTCGRPEHERVPHYITDSSCVQRLDVKLNVQ
jgi:hypothetical protein